MPASSVVDDRLVQPLDLGAAQPPGRLQRMDAGAEQRLVGVDVPDAGDAALVEQERLHRRLAARAPARASTSGVKAGSSGSGPSRSPRYSSSASRPSITTPVPKRRMVDEQQAVAVVEHEPHAQVRPLRRVLAGGDPEQVAGHAQVHDEEALAVELQRSGTCRGGRARSIAPAAQRRARPPRGAAGAHQSGSSTCASHDRAARHARRELAADRLDLGKLGHP